MVGERDPKPPTLHEFLAVRIEGRPPTLNARRHWRAVAADNKAWKATATAEALKAKHQWEEKHGLRWRPIRRVAVSVAFGLKDRRRRDWDNLISSLKPLIDGLVEAGLIVDDSTDVITKIEFGALVTGTTETIITVDEGNEP